MLCFSNLELLSKSLHVLDVFRDISTLVMHDSKLSRERDANQYPTYPVPEFNVGDKVLVQNHISDVLNPQYDFAYHVVCVIG